MDGMEGLKGGSWDHACGFATGIAVVAAFATGPLAPATFAAVATGFTFFCLGSAASHIKVW